MASLAHNELTFCLGDIDATKQVQANTRVYVDSDLCHQMASLAHNEWVNFLPGRHWMIDATKHVPTRHQAIIWANAGLLSIRPLGTNFSEILI